MRVPIRDIVFKEERHIVSVSVFLKRVDIFVDRNATECQPTINPVKPFAGTPRTKCKILLRRIKRIRIPMLSKNYVSLHEKNITTGQANDPNSFDDAVSCKKRYNWRNSGKRLSHKMNKLMPRLLFC